LKLFLSGLWLNQPPHDQAHFYTTHVMTNVTATQHLEWMMMESMPLWVELSIPILITFSDLQFQSNF
jgi:hypothetical protein